MVTEKCSICDNELTNKDQNLKSPYDGIIVCEGHRSFANYMIPEVAKMKLGLITEYPERLKKCSICDICLNEIEIQSISMETYLPVCTKHKVAGNMFNRDLAKEWFAYAEMQPQPFEYTEENRTKWLEYRDKEWQKNNQNKTI